ncbi:hypothetical protein [Bradyrhizobium sp. AZCC 1678]|uniref:hypothetical protein n=1 Tax=Bradyrhizobium sp. AZCC 1678 TaxID=3117030 RepID=UPI002FEF9C2D
MEKIGTGLNKLWFAPTKSGLYRPSAPIMTVQFPDTGGSNGSSKGGAGNVNAVWADARSKTATVALRAASVVAKKVRCAPLVGKRRAASMACFIKGASDGGPLCQGQLVWIRARSKSLANIAPRLPPATSNDDEIEQQINIA